MNEKTQTSNSSGAEDNSGWLPCVLGAGVVFQVIALAEPLCEDIGMELVFVEFQRENSGKVLRIYIDKTGGVLLDDCASISRELSDLFDVYLDEKTALGPYRLEVSSPGTNRPIGKKRYLGRFLGCRAGIRTTRPRNGQKNFSGIIAGISKGSVDLQTEKETVSIPFEEIARARLINYHGEI